jgi:AcrR family transcriptional regulator
VQKKAVKQAIPDQAEEAKPGKQPATQRNRELRIREIIDAARQVLQEDGYARFATRRVADRVGITHGNLQYYFRTTEDLLRTALSAYVSQVMEDYAAIANRPGMGAAQRCSALISRIFENINETDLPKFMVEIWAFAWHEAYVADLANDMQARFRSIFVKLLSELHPTLTSEECLVRAVVIGAQVDGMTIFASHGAYPGRDYVEFVRVAKRTIKMMVSASPDMLKSEAPLHRALADAHGSSDAQAEGLGSEESLQSRLLGLRVPQAAQDAFYYRPTAQGKRREVKINEIVSTAANLLATEGYANFTMARVARELGILPSALQNYFPTFDDLLRTTMDAVGQVYLESFAEIGKPSDKPALERLCEIVTLFEETRDPVVYRLWSEMWALAQHSEITRELLRNGYAAYRVVCSDLIREIDSSATARECLARATLIAALADGAFVLNFSPQRQPVSVESVFEVILAITARVAHGQIATSDAA